MGDLHNRLGGQRIAPANKKAWSALHISLTSPFGLLVTIRQPQVPLPVGLCSAAASQN